MSQTPNPVLLLALSSGEPPAQPAAEDPRVVVRCLFQRFMSEEARDHSGIAARIAMMWGGEARGLCLAYGSQIASRARWGQCHPRCWPCTRLDILLREVVPVVLGISRYDKIPHGEGWKALARRVRVEFGHQNEHQVHSSLSLAVCRFLRRQRYRNDHPSWSWEQAYASDEPAIRAALYDRMKGCDCVDNVRVADKSRPHHVRRYRAQKERGCCGRSDTTVQVGDKTYLIGFNYGH